MRTLFILLILLLQILLGWLIYNDQTTCCGLDTEGVSPTMLTEPAKPLVFSWSSALPDTSEGWLHLKDSLIHEMSDGKKLEITGYFVSGDEMNTESDSLSMLRAMAVKKLFPELREEQFIVMNGKMSFDTTYRQHPFEAVKFNIRTVTENIQETADETVIYFPSNSTRELNANDVTAYLREVAARVKKSGEIVLLTGHTDNVGSEKSNMALSRKRAEVIQQYLLDQGVPPAQIKLEAKGESEPIDDNSTAIGRDKNRRTVLKILNPSL